MTVRPPSCYARFLARTRRLALFRPQAAQNIARETELGTLERLNVTPNRWGCSSASWFGIPMRGSVPLLFGVAGIYLVVAVRQYRKQAT